jgi:hypothetical protein
MPKKKIASEEYLLKAKNLSKEQVEYVLSRLGGKLGRRLEDNKLAALEALAIQLEIEDEQLKEWRERFSEIRKKYLNQIKSAKL